MKKLLYGRKSIEKKTYEECISSLIDETKTLVSDWFFLLKANECLYCTHIERITDWNIKEKAKTNQLDGIYVQVQDKDTDDMTLSIAKPTKKRSTKKAKEEVKEEVKEEKPKATTKRKRGRPRKKVVVEEKTSE